MRCVLSARSSATGLWRVLSELDAPRYIVTASRLPIQTRFGWERMGFGWGWMGDRSPSKPIQTHFRWDTAGLFLDFGWAFPADGVVPSSALVCADSRGRPEGQRGILGRPGRFICRNLVLKPCDHYLESPRASRNRSRQFSSSWFKYHPKMYASDYIPRNRRR